MSTFKDMMPRGKGERFLPAVKRPHIDTRDVLDTQFWALVYGVTEYEIRHAVNMVGSCADTVSHYLRFQERTACEARH
ncbi:DUF3606 domain-containing protein [Piscinibacter terrae]|nr:DUF3606 domain-containing protein [Albitalea terrae]